MELDHPPVPVLQVATRSVAAAAILALGVRLVSVEVFLRPFLFTATALALLGLLALLLGGRTRAAGAFWSAAAALSWGVTVAAGAAWPTVRTVHTLLLFLAAGLAFACARWEPLPVAVGDLDITAARPMVKPPRDAHPAERTEEPASGTGDAERERTRR